MSSAGETKLFFHRLLCPQPTGLCISQGYVWRFLQWTLKLPTTLERRLEDEIKAQEATLPYLTPIEERAVERGRVEGSEETLIRILSLYLCQRLQCAELDASSLESLRSAELSRLDRMATLIILDPDGAEIANHFRELGIPRL